MLRETTMPFQQLSGHKYISLTTFRKNGQPVSTPVWFAEVDDRLYVLSMPKSGKIKRIRRNAQVEVAPCDGSGNVLGESMEAMALILPESEFWRADQALTRKYGLSKRLFMMLWRLQGTRPLFLEITAM